MVHFICLPTIFSLKVLFLFSFIHCKRNSLSAACLLFLFFSLVPYLLLLIIAFSSFPCSLDWLKKFLHKLRYISTACRLLHEVALIRTTILVENRRNRNPMNFSCTHTQFQFAITICCAFVIVIVFAFVCKQFTFSASVWQQQQNISFANSRRNCFLFPLVF